jgi:predicted porin
MKKSLLALAVLGAFAGAASAQSSVTMYGLLDLAITKGNGGTSGNNGANGLSEAYLMKQSAASRLGFRGTEDIGGGWSAQFQIEHRFTPDDGNTNVNTPFWGARSYVQITNAAVGSVYMGRDYGPEFWPAVKVDPFGWDGVAQINGMQYANYSTALNGASSVRTSNTGGFKSRSFGGLTVQLAVSLGEGAAGAGRVVGGNVEYAGGPIYAGLGFSQTTDGTNDDHQLINFGAGYDLGFIRPLIYFAQSKTGPAGTITGRDIMLALTAPIGPGKLKFAFDRLDSNTSLGNTTLANSILDKVGIGYDYPLSKRTNVYVDYGQGKSKFAGATVNRAAAVGMKHTF